MGRKRRGDISGVSKSEVLLSIRRVAEIADAWIRGESFPDSAAQRGDSQFLRDFVMLVKKHNPPLASREDVGSEVREQARREGTPSPKIWEKDIRVLHLASDIEAALKEWKAKSASEKDLATAILATFREHEFPCSEAAAKRDARHAVSALSDRFTQGPVSVAAKILSLHGIASVRSIFSKKTLWKHGSLVRGERGGGLPTTISVLLAALGCPEDRLPELSQATWKALIAARLRPKRGAGEGGR